MEVAGRAAEGAEVTCIVCGVTALYRVGKAGYCRRHKSLATFASKRASLWHSVAFEAAHPETDEFGSQRARSRAMRVALGGEKYARSCVDVRVLR